MIRYRLVTTLLTMALTASLPLAAAAQDGTSSPEGTAWKLTGYRTDDELTAVPFGTTASLLLEEGRASGSGGCNTFSGTYLLDGAALVFGDEFATTLKLCSGEVQSVEDAYLATLPQVTGWVIGADILALTDSVGETLLTLEVPSISLTASELANLVTVLGELRSEVEGLRSQIATLRRDVTGLDVDRLRNRIKVLERDRDRLQDQVTALEESPRATPEPPASSFSAAEKVLLEAIPARISGRCGPLRSELPTGARAGVGCVPNSSAVASVDYFLLEGSDAAAVFQDTMEAFDVPEATSESATCATGDTSQRLFIGRGWQSEGCYRTGGKAELRFVDNATACTQLKVGGKRLKSPALYIALHGADGDIARVHEWATRSAGSASTQLTSITQPIERPGERRSPSCPT